MPWTIWYGFQFSLQDPTRCGEFNFELGDGTQLSGFVHRDWLEAGVDLKVTAMDLKSAYKQLPLMLLSPLDSDEAVISLWNEVQQDVDVSSVPRSHLELRRASTTS